jgi:purine-binding chemotaxis protein CheW
VTERPLVDAFQADLATSEAEARLTPDDVRRLLRQRAEALAKPVANDLPAGAQTPVLVIGLGEERHGIEVANISGVAPLKGIVPIPGAPAPVLGVVLHRGRVLTLIHLGPLLGYAARPESAEWFVVVEAAAMTFGVVADTVEGIRNIDIGRLGQNPSADERDDSVLVKGLTEDLVTILDGAVLARDPRIRVDDEA